MIKTQLDYLEPFRKKLNLDLIQKEVDARESFLHRKDCPPYWQTLENQPQITAQNKDYGDIVTIGSEKEIEPTLKNIIKEQLKTFIAWRKGPFSIFGIDIDSEWRSDWKWQRIAPFIDPLKNRKVCDVGCNNGYYMFRMAQQKPKLVLGLDPVHRYKFTFTYLQNFAKEPNLQMELLGFEHLPLFPNFFDVIFLMGVIYHHRSPIELLENAWKALRPNGQIIVDSMGIPGTDPIALFPGRRYTKIPGVWFLPTVTTLKNWLIKSRFHEIQCIYNEMHTEQEQRRTKWSPPESLKEFLDPNDTMKTIEGFPRPWRMYFTARKKS